MQRRSQIERYLAILESLSGEEEQRAYHIACNARLKWVDLAEDLKNLAGLGLVRSNTNKSGVFYSLTPGGLQTYEKYKAAVNVFGKTEIAAKATR